MCFLLKHSNFELFFPWKVNATTNINFSLKGNWGKETVLGTGDGISLFLFLSSLLSVSLYVFLSIFRQMFIASFLFYDFVLYLLLSFLFFRLYDSLSLSLSLTPLNSLNLPVSLFPHNNTKSMHKSGNDFQSPHGRDGWTFKYLC